MPTEERKGRPIPVRLRRDFEELLKLEAERSGASKTRMLETLAEEALKMRRYPGIIFRGPEHRRRTPQPAPLPSTSRKGGKHDVRQ